MTQTTISTNGRSTSPATPQAPTVTDPTVSPDRRQTASSPSVSPEVLVERHVENARRQLAEARERLKGARRRVVQLEDALANWERFAGELRDAHGDGRATG
jgi:hypothetical protein